MERRSMRLWLSTGVVIVVQTLLFWGGMTLVERSESVVARGVLVAILAASLVALWFGLWFGFGILEGGYQGD
jgi:hypothetical protein